MERLRRFLTFRFYDLMTIFVLVILKTPNIAKYRNNHFDIRYPLKVINNDKKMFDWLYIEVTIILL